jgi:uncharacterized membrane protein YfcA
MKRNAEIGFFTKPSQIAGSRLDTLNMLEWFLYPLAGGVVGILAGLLGIGGGALSIPFMMWCNVPVHHAIGTSAAIGFPIAVAGTIGYIVNGLSVPGLPSPHLGYLYLPALFGLACFSFFLAPLGAKLAHKTPVVTLKRVYAVFLIVIATRMIWGILQAP